MKKGACLTAITIAYGRNMEKEFGPGSIRKITGIMSPWIIEATDHARCLPIREAIIFHMGIEIIWVREYDQDNRNLVTHAHIAVQQDDHQCSR